MARTRTATAPAGFRSGLRVRPVLLTTLGQARPDGPSFEAADTLPLGAERAGVPAPVHARADLRARIAPAAAPAPLNIAVAAGIALAEAPRRTGGWPE